MPTLRKQFQKRGRGRAYLINSDRVVPVQYLKMNRCLSRRCLPGHPDRSTLPGTSQLHSCPGLSPLHQGLCLSARLSSFRDSHLACPQVPRPQLCGSDIRLSRTLEYSCQHLSQRTIVAGSQQCGETEITEARIRVEMIVKMSFSEWVGRLPVPLCVPTA